MGQSEFRFLELTNIPFSKETKYKINHICRGIIGLKLGQRMSLPSFLSVNSLSM